MAAGLIGRSNVPGARTDPQRALRKPHRSTAGARLAILVAGLASIVALGGCFAASEVGPASASPVLLPSVPPTVELTATQVESALRLVGIGLIRPQTPFRPGESPALMNAPRTVYQAVLNSDPGHGYIVIYEFADAATAFAAGQEMAAYMVSGPGRVQFANDVHAVLRQLGTTLVFFTWSPSGAVDPNTGKVETALDTLGQGIPVTQ